MVPPGGRDRRHVHVVDRVFDVGWKDADSVCGKGPAGDPTQTRNHQRDGAGELADARRRTTSRGTRTESGMIGRKASGLVT